MRTRLLFALLAALSCSLATAPAHARARVFVASYGNDSNPCTFGSPCKTFQQAVNVVDAGGEVTAIDSAGFGPIAITKAVTITSPDGVEAGIVAVAGGDAIDINAGPNDDIVLRGLTLDGSGIAANGVVFNSGGSLTITNCVVQNFADSFPNGNGILMQPSMTLTFVITNTIVANNHQGIAYLLAGGAPTAKGVIDHATVTTNLNQGILFSTLNVSGGSIGASISNSIVSNNGLDGIFITNGASGSSEFTIDNVNIFGSITGIDAESNVQVLLSRSVITGNSTGVMNGASPNRFFTYQNNQINENVTDISSSLNTGVTLR